MRERRRTERIFLRVPMIVRGLDESGTPFMEEAFTVEINRDGARIGLKNTPRLSSELQATNLANDSGATLVVKERCPQSYDGLPEWAVRFAEPNPEFWGIVFDEKDEERRPSISALLTCQVCGRQELVSISFQEYETLCARLFLPRLCSRCHIVAKWEVGSPGEGTAGQPRTISPTAEEPPPTEPDSSKGSAEEAAPHEAPSVPQPATAVATAEPVPPPEPASPPAPAEPLAATLAEPVAAPQPTAAQDERRRERRLTLKVPILVRSHQGDSEQTESSDVSRNGMSFTTTLDLSQGELVEITVGYGVASSPSVRTAKIAWRRPEAAGPRRLVGVWFTQPQGA